MNAYLQRLLLTLALLPLHTAHAVNHNPDGQGKKPETSDVSIGGASAEIDSKAGTVLVTVTVNSSNPKPLSLQPVTLGASSGSWSGAPKTVGSGGSYSFTIPKSSNIQAGDVVSINLTGMTGGNDSTTTTVTCPPPSKDNKCIYFYYDLGQTSSGSLAGRLLLEINQPDAEMFSPRRLGLIGIDPTTEIVTVPIEDDAVIRQALSATQLTDIVETENGYELRFYLASQKGAKVNGLYQPVGSPFKVATVENPGPDAISGTTSPELFYEERFGEDFSYELPVVNGPYEVELFFSELYHDQPGDGVFNVSAEGSLKLAAFDVLAAAGSKKKAISELFASDVRDGALSLHFQSVTYGAHVSAIKVVRASPSAISGTTDSPLFASERHGNFTYDFILPNGDYEVVLYFAEIGHAAAGQRLMDVSAEGLAVLSGFDIFAEAGAHVAHETSFPVTVTDGELNLGFSSLKDSAKVNAIKIVTVPGGAVVAAINAGSGLSYTATDSTVFSADTHFTGGAALAPGMVALAINAGGTEHDDGGVVFEADRDFSGGSFYRGATNRFRLSEAHGGDSAEVYDYHWITEPKTGAFGENVLTFPGSLKKKGRHTIYTQDRLTYDDIVTLRDTNDNLVSKTVTTYEKFAFGFQPVREVQDPDGAALTTTWTYYEGSQNPDDPKPDDYALPRRMVRSDGYWEDYFYDANRALVKKVRTYQDSSLGDEAQSVLETFAYSKTNPTLTHITKIKGQEVARRYRAVNDQGDQIELLDIICLTVGAAWNAADNLVTKTRYYSPEHTTEHLRNRDASVSRPDGTATLFGYVQSGTDLIVTTDTGAPNLGGTAIVAGTRTVATYNEADQQIGEETIDIASGLTLSEWAALTVDALGRPTLIGHGDGTTREIAYVGSSASCGSCSSAGNYLVASEADRNGVTTTYAYDALNRRTGATRLGVTEHVVYDAADRVVQRIRIGSDASEIVQEKITYDLAGRVVAVEDALENETTIAYAYPVGGGTVTTTTLPATAAGSGTRIETTFADGRTKEIAGTAVSPLRYAYGTWSATGQAGQWTQEIKVGEADSETEWVKSYADLAGRQVKTEYPDSAYAAFAYNALGQLVKQIDPDGVATLFAYNAEGQREVTAIDLNHNGQIDYAGADRIAKSTTDVYSRSGTVVRRSTTQVWATDNSNTATTVSIAEQDGYGDQAWQTDAAGAESSTAISRTGAGAWTVTATAPDGSQQVQTHTGGRLASSATYTSTSTLITQTTFGYDAHGRVETQTDARTGDTDYTYSDRDEVLSVTVNNGSDTTLYTYDALGNQLTVTLPDSSVTTNEYHLRNSQLKKTSGSQTYPVEYSYDPQGRMKTMTTWQNATTSSGAAVTTWNYDAQRGWLSQKLYADTTGPAYEYTPAGRLAKRTWARAVSSVPLTTTYAYNNAGDLASTDYSDSTPDVAITYTRFGAQKTVNDATGERTFTYTAALLPDQEQLPAYYGDRILTRSYQGTGSGEVPGRADGFELGVTGDFDQDYAVIYGYDTAGRLNTVADPNGTFTYGYLANSNLRSSATSAVYTSAWTYEPYRNVIASLENKVGVNTVSKFHYTVNSFGQRTQRQQSGTAFGTASVDVFSYNAKGEVVGSTNAILPTRDQAFNYDDIGNRLTSTNNIGTTNYTANSLNQYSGILVPSSQFLEPSHDADGNQTANGLGQAYVWDAENRLISVEPLIPGTGDKKVVNTYDAQSRRVRRAVFTYTSGSWVLTTDEKFIYDDWNVVAVLGWNPSTSAFDLNRTLTWGLDLSGSLQGAGGVGGLLAVKDGGDVYRYTYDANGNVSEVLDDSGVVVAHYEYDAFGDTFVAFGTYATTNEYRFSTKPLDATSGLYYYGFRYYNPSTGRWLSRDPIEERGGVNLYGFILNNPLRFYDFLGLDPNESNGFTPSSESGVVNCAGYAGSGGQQYVYRAPSERGVTGRSMMDDMEAEGWACSLMTGPTCEAPCEFEKMVITNWRTGNDANRDENGRMRDSFTEDDIQFGRGASSGLTDYHAIYSPSGCSPTYSQILGRHPAGTAPEPDIIPADFSGRQYCCKRKKK